MSEIKYTPSELRRQIRHHMWGLTGDDTSAQGSIDYGDFLIDQLEEAVRELAIYGYRGPFPFWWTPRDERVSSPEIEGADYGIDSSELHCRVQGQRGKFGYR